MASVNKVILVGNLGMDPDSRYMPNGDAVCTISLATTDTWKDKASGEKMEATEWHRLVFYRRLAEIAAEYLRKGASIYVEGRIHTKKWDDRDGITRYTTEIIVSELQMLGKRPVGDAPRGSDDGDASGSGRGSRKPADNSNPGDFEDDIPF